MVKTIDSYVTAVTNAANDNEFGYLSNNSVPYYIPVSNTEDNSYISLEQFQ